MQNCWFNKWRLMWLLAVAWLLPKTPVQAAGGLHEGSQVQHYINLYAGGGMMLPFATTEAVDDLNQQIKLTPLFGGDGFVGFGYELRNRLFILGLGVEGNYQLHNITTSPFTDYFSIWASQPGGWSGFSNKRDQIDYYYHYSDYEEQAHEARIAIPFHVGMYFTSHFFGTLGAKFSFSLWDQYRIAPTIETEAFFHDFAVDGITTPSSILDVAWYGIYAPDVYTFHTSHNSRNFVDRMYSTIAPMAELGGRWALTNRINLRLSAYVEYAIPIGWPNPMQPHADYTNVNQYPGSMSREPIGDYSPEGNLRENLIMNPVRDNDFFTGKYMSVTFGVKLTFNFNVTPSKHICICELVD